MKDDALGYGSITCSDPSKLQRWTTQQLLRNIDLVLECRRQRAGREITKTRLDQVIKAAGFWLAETCLFADMELRLQCDLVAAWSYDWTRTAFQDGFMSNAMWLLS